MHLIFEPADPIATGEDAVLAKAVEAGLYATELIDRGDARPELRHVADAGAAALQRLWTIGLRIAHQQASALARNYQLPYDDVFQDACVAVAVAVRSFDYTRGVRFTTYAYTGVRHALTNASVHRTGAPVSRSDRAAAARAAQVQDQLAATGVRVAFEQAARLAGVSRQAASRAASTYVSLEDITLADEAAQVQFAAVETVDTDFLILLSPRSRRVLTLRYGLGETSPHTTVEAAAVLGASAATVHRWEHQALLEAKEVLTAERTTAVRAEARTAVA